MTPRGYVDLHAADAKLPADMSELLALGADGLARQPQRRIVALPLRRKA